MKERLAGMWSSGRVPEREKEVKLRVVRTAEMTAPGTRVSKSEG